MLFDATYITVEGIDGSGKSSLAKDLAKSLENQGFKVLLTREFGSTHDLFCKEIRDIALSDRFDLDEEAAQIIFGALIKQHQEKVIKPNLKKYDFIISDRGPLSNYAYGPAHGIDKKFIKRFFNLIYENAVKPTQTIVINIPVKIAQKRLSLREKEQFKDNATDRIEKKGASLQRKVAKNFLKLAEKNNHVILSVNEETTQESLLNDALNKLNDLIQKRKNLKVLR